MSAKTIFEIAPTPSGFRPTAAMSWGSGGSGAAGPLCFESFPTQTAAQHWLEEQFSIPPEAWHSRDGLWRACRVIEAGLPRWWTSLPSRLDC